MNIGIVIYSQTGNTLSVARELKEILEEAGHTAKVDQVTVSGEAPPRAKEVQLDEIPPVDGYDVVVFGAPVHAFSLSSAMSSYLEQLPALEGKKVACFVTKQLPFSWTGGTQAARKMKQICESKGAEICGTEIVIWAKSRRETRIKKCAENLANLF